MRTPLLAGNWKMNKLNSELPAFFEAFVTAAGPSLSVDLIFAVPATLLSHAARLAVPRGMQVAAQNVHWAPSGAYTGEVSLGMIKEAGATATLIGHSERRQYFAETDETVQKKAKAALDAGIMPIVCVGESLAERDQGQTFEVVSRQLRAGLALVEKAGAGSLVLAYEPVWAIGTGKSATASQAQEVHAAIRSMVKDLYGESVSTAMRLLYGGSATPANFAELLAQPDIDGGLIGGASLKAADFAAMARTASTTRS